MNLAMFHCFECFGRKRHFRFLLTCLFVCLCVSFILFAFFVRFLDLFRVALSAPSSFSGVLLLLMFLFLSLLLLVVLELRVVLVGGVAVVAVVGYGSVIGGSVGCYICVGVIVVAVLVVVLVVLVAVLVAVVVLVAVLVLVLVLMVPRQSSIASGGVLPPSPVA